MSVLSFSCTMESTVPLDHVLFLLQAIGKHISHAADVQSHLFKEKPHQVYCYKVDMTAMLNAILLMKV